MLFDGLNFIILPNLNASATQFRCKIIEENGGTILSSPEEIEPKTVVLIIDSFVNDDRDGIEQVDLFQKETVFDLDIVFDAIMKYELPCFKISSISVWISQQMTPYNNIEDIIHFKESGEESQVGNETKVDIETGENKMELEEKNHTSGSESNTGIEEDNERDEDSTSIEPTHFVNDKYINLDSSWKDNKLLIDTLGNLSKKYKIKGDRFRARGYNLARSSIEKCKFKITSGKQAQRELANIGPSIGEKIQIILDTGTLPGVRIVSPTEQTLRYFQKCHGVGPALARKWSDLQLESFKKVLHERPNEFATEWPSLYGWAYYNDWQRPIPRRESEFHFSKVKEYLHLIDPDCQVEIQGSYNRGKEYSGDIDLLFFKKGIDEMSEIAQILEQLVTSLYDDGYINCVLQLSPRIYDLCHDNLKAIFLTSGLKLPERTQLISNKNIRKYFLGVTLKDNEFVLTPQERDAVYSATSENIQLKGQDRFMSLSSEHKSINPCRRMDFFSCKWSELGAARLQWTGSAEFNRWIRLRATSMNYKLTQHGLFQDDKLIESFDERRIFKLLNCPYVGYKEREQGLWQRRVGV